MLKIRTAYRYANVEVLRRESSCWLSLLGKPILHDTGAGDIYIVSVVFITLSVISVNIFKLK